MTANVDVHPASARAAATLSAQLGRLFSRALADAVAPLDLAPAPYLVLRELWRLDGQTQSALARRLEVEQATMANTLKRMVRDGLVVFEAHASDKRALNVRLTPRAAALEKSAKAAARRVGTRALAGLSRKEQKRFVELSERIVAALKPSVSSPGAADPVARQIASTD